MARELQMIVGELRLRQPVRLKGSYFAATGSDSTRQAFVHDLILRLMSEQNDVAWLPEWISRDVRCRFWAVILSVITFVFLSTDAWLAFQIFADWSRR